MLVDIKALTVEFGAFSDALSQLGKANHLDIHTMHEDIFNSMHRI
jgi:ACT domain-containing protein